MARNLDSQAATKLLQFGKLLRGSHTALRSSTATAVTSTTPVTVASAPAAGRSLYIRRALFINVTPAESPHVTVREIGSSTPIITVGVGDAFGNDGVYEHVFEPPIKVTAATGVQALSNASVGDVLVTVEGVTGPSSGEDYLDPFETERQFLVGTKLPDDAVPIYSANGTLITGTTPQTILPAAGVGKAYYISGIAMSNVTPAEAPFIVVTTVSGGSTVTILGPSSANDNSGFIELPLRPLFVTAENESVQAATVSGSLGDTTVVIHGFHGSILS